MQIVMDGIQSFQTFRRQPTTNSYRAIIYLFEHGGKDIDLLLASFQYILNNQVIGILLQKMIPLRRKSWKHM